jgi:glycosyltransferase involved in cell wall biosynthesis
MSQSEQGAPGSVAIVVAVRDGARYLAEALESALAQTRPAVEIVVVDDGSADDSAEIARRVDGVRVICQANAGLAAARNAGQQAVQSDYVVFLDHDDRLLPDNLAVNAGHLDAAPVLGFVGGRSVTIDEEGRRLRFVEDADDPPSCTYESLLRGTAFVPPSTVMFRRAALEAIGGADPTMRDGAEDLDVYLRVARDWPVRRHGRTVVEYRRHGANKSSNALALLRSSHDLLERQRAFCAGDARLLEAIAAGKAHWSAIYGPGLVGAGMGHLRRGRFGLGLATLAAALRHHPAGFPRYARARLARSRASRDA